MKTLFTQETDGVRTDHVQATVALLPWFLAAEEIITELETTFGNDMKECKFNLERKTRYSILELRGPEPAVAKMLPTIRQYIGFVIGTWPSFVPV